MFEDLIIKNTFTLINRWLHMKINLWFNSLIEILEKLWEILFSLLFILPLNLRSTQTPTVLIQSYGFNILGMCEYLMDQSIDEEVVSLLLITLGIPYHCPILDTSHRVDQYREFLEKNKQFVVMIGDYSPVLDEFLSLWLNQPVPINRNNDEIYPRWKIPFVHLH